PPRPARPACMPGGSLPGGWRRRRRHPCKGSTGRRLARHLGRRRRDAGAGFLPRPVRDRPIRPARRKPGRTPEPDSDRPDAGNLVLTRIFVPRDAAALAVGARGVASALAGPADVAPALAGHADVVRTGSRGLFWLEPMIEVETAQGRIAYGPVDAADIP